MKSNVNSPQNPSPRRAATRLVRKTVTALAVMVFLTACAEGLRADLYITYRTTRHYSANRQYFLQVNTRKTAVLYRRRGRGRTRVWSRKLGEIPGTVLVSNDGRRVILIDYYYGNRNRPDAPVIRLLNERGRELSNHPLKEVINLSRAVQTVSGTDWHMQSGFSPDEKFFLIETVVAKCKRNPAEDAPTGDDCDRLVPYERLRFSTQTGELASRSPLTEVSQQP